MDSIRSAIVTWSVASRARRGEVESGDGYFVETTACEAIVAVVDGVGHGGPAAAAMRTALAHVALNRDRPLHDIVRRCHAALPETRGAVMGLGRFDARDGTLAWLGIGNVSGTVLRALGGCDELLPRGGLLGRNLPSLGPSVLPVHDGDTLIVTTDGVRWRYDDSPIPLEAPEQMARRILADHASGEDDALVLVVRYLGTARGQA